MKIRSRFILVFFMLVLLAGIIVGCSTLDVINGLTRDDTYIATKNLPYGTGSREKLDVYQPRLPKNKQAPPEGYPVVVFFYGGAWGSGERADYKFVGEALAEQGIVTIIADYRLYPQVRYPDFLKDCASVVAWALREASHYGGDSKRLYVMGHSAGGYNAAMLALDPRWLGGVGLTPSILAGWVGLAGPYDFYPMGNLDAQPVFFHPNYPANSQPIDFVSKTTPRTFLGAATKDEIVDPERNTKQLAQKLRAAGIQVTIKLYSDVSHYTLIGAFARPLRGLAPVLKDVGMFVRGDPMD